MEFLEKITPREYQQKIFESCVRKNCLVVLPTGLGKTLIALMLAVERMKKFPGEKVVFLAPTKPLAEQHLSYFTGNLPELFGSLELFTGAVDSKKRQEIWETADIVFSTPQCVANDISKGLYNLEEVCLLIEDEAHRCFRNYSYNYVAKRYMETAKHPRILGLTASPGSEASKIKEICRNLSIEEVELRTRESPDVAPYLQELKFEKVILELPKKFQEIREALLRLFHSYVDELRNRKVFFGMASKTELIKLQKKIMFSISRGNKNYNTLLAASACAQAVKLQHALELLETQTLHGFSKYLKELMSQAAKKQTKGVVRLVSKPEFAFAFAASEELLAKGQEHPKIESLRKIVKKEFRENEKAKMIVFSQFRETARILCKTLNSIKGIKARIFIGQARKIVDPGKGKETSEISGLSQKEQKKIIQEFSNREINVLCATSIGEEGLDIPEVNVVVFYEPVASAIRAIQRAGRTARLMGGKLIMLITRKTRDEAYFYASRAKEKRMHSAISSIKENLKNGSGNSDEFQRTL
ncbi:MAG TPA: DEAD/DEAH box helicase [Candidatus Nanoarchaeia archaeon]|nr:DEAD/DEAH box helicase [Candidatus Nanoarchaeia archaeon]